MPIVNVPGVGQVRFPDEMSEKEIIRAIERDILPKIEKPEEGLGAALKGGASRLLSTVQTGIESLFDAEGAAKRGLAREEEIARKYAPATSLEAVKKAYAERGILPAAGEVASQVPGAVVEQAPQIATTLGAARLGAMAGAPFGPVGAVIGGVGGAVTPSLLQLFGSNIQRQAEEGQPISRTRAAAAAAPGAALEVASTFVPLGRSLVGKLLGPEAEKLLARGGSKVADEGLARVLAKGAGVGAAFEIPTEVIQQMLERQQAGLSLTTPDAYAEYGEAAYGAGLVGGPFGAVGRVGQRMVARGERDREALEQRRLDEQIAAKEREAAEAAETARKTTPEFRQELNAQIVALQDELRQVEPVAKDKKVDEEVRNEAKARATEIKKELKDLNEQMRASMKTAGAPTSLADELAKRARQTQETQVVDEFGNVITPKAKPLTEQEIAAGYEQQAESVLARDRERQAALQRLRDKEEAERQKVYEQTQQGVQRYMAQLQELEDMDINVRTQRELEKRQKGEKEVTFERALERIQKAIDNFGFNVLGYKSDEAVQALKNQIADLSRPESIAAAPDRDAQLKQIDDLKAQLATATQEASRTSGEGMRRLIDEGRVTRDITKALGIEGLGGRSVDAVDALPNIEARIAELETKRKDITASKKALMEDDGTLTTAGMRLVQDEVRLNELKRLREVGQQRGETAGEGAISGLLQAAPEAPGALAVDIEPNKPSGVYKQKAEQARKNAGGAFIDLTALMDDYRQGRFLGEGASPAQRKLASYRVEDLLKEAEGARKSVVDGYIEEIAYKRKLQNLRPLTRDEAIGAAIRIDEALKEIINRSTALPRGMVMEDVVIEPAQMRGSEIVKEAKTARIDPRPLAERQFGNPRRAIEVLAEVIKQTRDATIEAGKGKVGKGPFDLAPPPQKAAPTDLVKDLDRVLRMENLQPDVRDTLEQARRSMEEGGISEGLEELIDEQVGRILRGTDKPFTLEYFKQADVTKPGGKRNMQMVGTAELIDEIKTQMRFDSQAQQFATTEQTDLFPATLATTRATPAQFQRFQKSKEVGKAKAKEQRLKTIEVAAKKVAREREITPANVAAKEKQIMDRIGKLAQDFRKNPEDMVSTKVSAQWAALDEDIKKEVAELKDMKAKLAKMSQGTPEQRAARAAVVRQQKLVDTTQSRYDKEDKARDALMARAREGLGLPGTRAISVVETTTRKKTPEEFAAEMKAYEKLSAKKQAVTPKPTKYEIGTARRVKVVPIKSKDEIDAELEERRSQQTTELRRKARVSSPEAMYNTLKEEEKAAVEMAQIKTKQLNDFVKAVNEGKAGKNFPKFKKMSAEVDAAKARVKDIRGNIRLLAATQYVPEAERKRKPARGPIGGAVPFYDKKFTPDQLRKMSGLGLSAFDSPRSYSVDDDIDFRIGEDAGGGIDMEQANKRMADVERKLPKETKFKYFPTMKDVTVDILNNMERQGVDIYETQIRGGVKPDGTVFVIGENHTDMVDLEKTLAHELIGHYTFEGMLGENGMLNLMLRLDKDFATKTNENGLENLADRLGLREEYDAAVISTGRFYEQQLAEGKITEKEVRRQAKTKALRELIAYTMEKGVDTRWYAKAAEFIKQLVRSFREFLKGNGLTELSKQATSDLFYLMKQANQTFEAGKPIAYKKANGAVDFRGAKAKYAPGMEDLGAITDKIVGRQQDWVGGIKANVMGLAGRVQFVDRFAALEELINRGVSRGVIGSLKAADTMYFNRMADQRHTLTAEVANNGGLKLKEVKRPDGTIEKIIESDRGPSLKDVSQALMGAGVGDPEATGRLFTLYLAAERAQRVGLDKLNYEGKLTQADLKKALDFGRANKSFQKARELYNEYNKGLIDFAVKTGAIDKKLGAKLSSTNDYVPYYRMRGGVVDLVIGSEQPIRIGDLKSQPYLEELVGGKEAIMDFFTSALQNTSLLTDMALRNMATYESANTLQDLGIAKIKPGDGPASPNVIRFKYNGEPYYAEIDTKAKSDLFGDIPPDLVVKGMEGIKIIIPGVVRGLAGPANILRKFVTRDPRYAIRQVFRDSMAAVFTTGANMTPVVDTMGQIAKMYSGKSEAYEKLQRRGILGGQVITGAPEDMQKVMQQITAGKPGWEMAMAKLDQWAQAGDAATRISMYNSFLKQGLSEREATLATLESMNFGRRGVSPSIYFLNATVPFFNAGIQGLDVLYRAYKGKMPYNEQLKIKQKLISRGLMMAGFTMAYAAMMQDDEAYKNATPEQRYSNWFIRIPGFSEPFRVPIPFDIGLIFKAVPEGVYNAAFTDEKGSKIAKDLALQLGRTLPGSPSEAGIPIPTFMKPFIETALNKSFFTGRDVVDARLEGLEKQFQYRDNTPELLKLIGPATAMIGLSPVQLENFIRGFTGSLGLGLISVLNPVLRTKEAGEIASKGITDMPYIGPIIGGLFQPNDAGRVINEAYDTVKEVQDKQRTYKKLIEDGQIEEAQQYVKSNVSQIGLAPFAGAFRQQMGEITKIERAVRAAPANQMTPDEKRERLDDLRKLKITLSQRFTDVREQIGRQAAR